MIRRSPLAAVALLALAAAGRAQEFEKALLRVHVPAPDARLEIQGKATQASGTTRLFASPMLQPGRSFIYDLKATWTENGRQVVRERSVRVMAGQTTEVDMATEGKVVTLQPPPATADTPKIPMEVKPMDPRPPVKPADTPAPMAPPKPADTPKPMDTPRPVAPMPPDPVRAAAPPKPRADVKLDVPYYATPEPVVKEMLKLANVKAGDVVYDLGCGDGRIVITAVKEFGAKKGVGIDIDPDRVKESQEAAKKAEVVAKVEFREADVLKLTEQDLAEATVVTMYLLPRVNDRLAPILKKLKSGTRIVSHDFPISDWQEDDRKELQHNGLDHTVFLWTVK